MPLVLGVDGHVLTGKFQGTRTTLGNLLRALASRVTMHELVVYADNAAEAQELLGTNRFKYRELTHAGSIKRLIRILPGMFVKDKVDVGVFQYMSPLTGKHIVFIHDILPLTHSRYFPLSSRLKTWLFYSISIWRAAMVIAVSEYTGREIERVFRLPKDRLRVIVNGPSFPVAVYEGRRTPPAERYILTVGRVEERKNVKLLVDAFMAVRPEGVKLVVVGSHDLGYNYTLPQDPMIEHLRNVDDAALIELYRGASLFVYPSAAEGFGMPLLDALLFGLPVISADNTALPEVAGPFATYFDCEADNAVSQLSGLIAGHFGDASIPAPTAADRAVLHGKFSWDRAAELFLDVADHLEAKSSK